MSHFDSTLRMTSTALIVLCLASASSARGPLPSITNHTPSSHQGLFDAEKGDGLLKITLRVVFDFVSGDPLEAPGYADEEYLWTDAAEHEFKEMFRRRVEASWSRQFALESTTGPERLEVELRVEETQQPDDAQWLIHVRRYPDDAPDTDAGVCGPGQNHYAGGCEDNHEDLQWGTVRLASTHLFPEHVRDLEIGPTDLWFDLGSSDPTDVTLHPATWLFGDSDWSVHLTGYANIDEVGDGAVPGQVRPTIELSRNRTERVRQALIDYACRCEPGRRPADDCRAEAAGRIRVVNRGHYGDGPSESRNFVRMEVFRRPEIDTLAHEAGHMLGLGDEASDDDWPVGSHLPSSDYSALVFWYFPDEVVLRHDDDGIMSRGTVVRERHYVTFLEVLELLSGSADWSVVPR